MKEEQPVEAQNDAIEEVIEQVEGESQDDAHEEQQESHVQVPLSALQKERKKRQELELELKWERGRQNQAPQAPQEEDNSRYETATREDLINAQQEAIRVVEERNWIRNNPEKYERVNAELETFLKQRPNLTTAIKDAYNRYEEAYALMNALSPKQQQQLKKPVEKKIAPGSPSSVPKAAALNEKVDIMSMTDSEYQAWRVQQKKRR